MAKKSPGEGQQTKEPLLKDEQRSILIESFNNVANHCRRAAVVLAAGQDPTHAYRATIILCKECQVEIEEIEQALEIAAKEVAAPEPPRQPPPPPIPSSKPLFGGPKPSSAGSLPTD